MISSRDIVLLSSRVEVSSFIPAIVAAADGERNSFGFLPARAYEDFAVQRRLIVAHDRTADCLAGYIVFGGTSPQARIFQTYVADDYRRCGVGKALIEEVVRRSEEASFLSIRVEVASDLEAANEFYKNQSFRRVREKSGGASRKRVIFTRVRELNSPSLLDFASYGVADGPAINLTLSTTTKSPLYLIDLNVLFDITRRRSSAIGARQVLGAAFDNSVALAVSAEFVVELERNTDPNKLDPVLELAKAWPRLKPPAAAVVATYQDVLGPLIFPDRSAAGKLSIQDKSDIAHLATAIEEGADGFITSEKAILGCADWFRTNHQLDVLSPDVFGKRHTATVRRSAGYQVLVSGQQVSVGDLTQHQATLAKEFLAQLETPDGVAKSAISQGTSTAPRRRIAVWADDKIIAYGSWAAPKVNDRILRLYLFADEANSACEAAVDHLLETAARDASVDAPAVLQLNPPPDCVLVRSRALSCGFRTRTGSSARSGKLEKLCLGSIVTENNWSALRTKIRVLAGIDLPEEPAVFQNPNDQIVLRSNDGRHAATGLGALEDFVSPAIFALRGRTAAIVPIWSQYAESLFRGSRQPSFLDDKQAALFRKRLYVGTARSYSVIPDQGLIFFYESGYKGRGRSAAIAVGRVVRRYLAKEGVTQNLSEERGVLSALAVKGIAKGNQACVTEFDNIMIFAKPVPLNDLKAIGCADESNMVSARRVGLDAALALIDAGQPTCLR